MKLLKGDCLELMKGIPDNSIDMVLTDLPYGTTKNKWDSVIPFEPMWEQVNRITKERTPILLFGQNPFSATLITSNVKQYKYDWFWQKSHATGFLNAKKRPLKVIENIHVFYNKQPNYFPQGLKPYGKMRSRKSIKGTSSNYGKYGQSNYSEFCNYPKDRIDFDIESYLFSTYKDTGKEKLKHPTQKPVALLEYLIKTYTLEGETVLDFTMGSGSTGVAAKNLNRKFIGIEMDEKYFKIAQERIGAGQVLHCYNTMM